MSRATAVILVICGCAGANAARPGASSFTRNGGDQAIYVGHSDTGQVLVSASHLASMSGVVMAEEELMDVKKKGKDAPERMLLCKREWITGSHVPQWYCRYASETELNKALTEDMIRDMARTGRTGPVGGSRDGN